MLSDPIEPVARVRVIGLAAMHNAVDECAVGIVNGLRNDVRCVQVVVP